MNVRKNRGVNLTHKQARELIQKSLESRLDAFESAAVAAHLAGCAECAAYEAEIQALDQRLLQSLVERWPDRRYPAAELDRKLASIQSRLRRDSMFRRASSFTRLAGAVAALIVLVAGLAWLVQGTMHRPLTITATGTATPLKATEVIPQPDRISMDEAGKLVREWVFANNPGMNADAQFPLQEITTDELWQRMKAQVYKVSYGVMMYDSFLVKEGQVWKLGYAFGEMGLTTLEVTDLDGNGSPELVYTYTFGSGIRQSSLGMATERDGQMVVTEANDIHIKDTLGLQKQDDRSLVLKQYGDSRVPESVTVGMVRLLNGRLVIAPDLADVAIYTNARFGLSFAYPSDWKPAGGQADIEQYSGPTGFFTLSGLPPGMMAQDLTRACEWLANGNPAFYGDLPQVSLLPLDQNREACLILSTTNGPEERWAWVFPVDGDQLALLVADPSHAQMIAQSLRFTQALPTQPSAPVDLTPQAPVAGGKLETRGLGDLILNEYAVVSANVDTPGHFEFNARIPESILQKRTGWLDYSLGKGLAQANFQLEPFGYQLERKQDGQGNHRFDLYQGSDLVKGDLDLYFPVSAYHDEQGSGDFAMLVEDNQGSWLVRKAGIEKWNEAFHHFTRPVMAGARLITVEREFDQNSATERVVVMQDRQPIYTYTLAPSPVEEQVKTLAEWNGGWVLEVNGTLIVNGVNYNQKDFQADEIFNWTILNGKPFFFFRRDGKFGAWYDGKELAVQYDEIIHGRCCEPGAFNVVNSPDALWFYARQDGLWYFVELTINP